MQTCIRNTFKHRKLQYLSTNQFCSVSKTTQQDKRSSTESKEDDFELIWETENYASLTVAKGVVLGWAAMCAVSKITYKIC